MSEPVVRNPFKLHVSILDNFDATDGSLMESHLGYPIDNVIQVKLSPSSFKALFRDTVMTTSATPDVQQRYDSDALLERLRSFFDRGTGLHNYNNLASDITTLIQNTYNDVDVNPVTLESACVKDGTIFDYFFKSSAQWQGSSISSSGEMDEEYGDHTGDPIKVYQLMAREIDNMISRNLLSTSEDGIVPDNSYDDLDALYTIAEEAFWDNSQEGDSIYIEGSFLVPTKMTEKSYASLARDGSESAYDPVGAGNLPVILQFVNSQTQTYSF